ncbi:hypothetical protein RJT34_09233 [Clitoria ternatea]|uniref:F-box protein At3g26010-like beta-propeller domain-containing protein n=1 Tax=Clitoria ternatea TaxID=43366 RepID=A0AAN9K8L9_CLITE
MAFPNDMLFEIFSWLPAKAIYKFTSCSKLLSKFPEETCFALKQAQNALSRDDTCFFIQPDINRRFIGQIELHPLPEKELSCGVSKDALSILSRSANIIASSNGLILCRPISHGNQVELFISNPATQCWLPIPTPEDLQQSANADLKIGFKCDLEDYKVFVFDHNNYDEWHSDLDCKVYLSKEGVWKAMEKSFLSRGRNLIFDKPVYHNGVIHFISDCFPYYIKTSPYFRPYIMSYNFSSGESRMMRVPKEARRGSHDYSCKMGIFKWGKVNSPSESICLVRLRKVVFTVWALINYESGLWKRILKVRVKAMGLTEKKDPIVTEFVVLNGELLVFATQKKVYGYGLSDEKYMRIEEICEHGFESKVRFTSYSNTLRPCGTGVRALPLSFQGKCCGQVQSLI